MKNTFHEFTTLSPITMRVSRETLPLKTITGLSKGMFGHDTASPMEAALKFYYINHVIYDVSAHKNPEEHVGKMRPVLDLYEDVALECGLRMFYYLLYICHRESRHNRWSSVAVTKMKYMNKHHEKVVKWSRENNTGIGSKQSAELLYNYNGDFTLGEYTQYLEDVFFKGKYGTCYGGKKWGEIAKVLNRFVKGEYSLEMLLDTSFTLAHNTGPIFNKGMFWANDVSGSNLIKVLDVQRAGFIPEYIKTTAAPSMVSLKEYQTVVQESGYRCGGYVDWFRVEVLGAVSQLHYEKKEQQKVMGVPKWYEEMQADKKEKKKAADALAIELKKSAMEEKAKQEALKLFTTIEVDHNTTVTKLKRVGEEFQPITEEDFA